MTGESGVPGEEGLARVTFTVSMQPGNNYRAAASLLEDAVSPAQLNQTKADAVYRENQLWIAPGMSVRGHAALVTNFMGPLTRGDLSNDDRFLLTEMSTPGVVYGNTLTTITNATCGVVSACTVMGCYTNPAINYVQRLKILQAVRSLVGANLGYPSFGSELVMGNNVPNDPKKWDGRLNSISHLRCDGLVEVCYEINGVHVWGMYRTPEGSTGFDITHQTDNWTYSDTLGTWDAVPNGLPDNLEEHNDFDLVGDWDDTLMPATQCGYVATDGGATKFRRQNLCLPVGAKGGNP